MELKDSQYQSGLKMLNGVEMALQQAISGVRKHEEHGTLRRRIEEVETLLRKVKRELRMA
jgi:ppGpp synthetase/RelA/SpoT-type nucleotidyltranferase